MLSRFWVAASALLLGTLAWADGCAWAHDWHSTAARPDAAVLVILSPRMSNALLRWPAMKRVAEDAGFNVCPLRDPRVPIPEWRAAVRQARLPNLADIPALDETLAQRWNVLQHAPTAVVFDCGQRHPWPILGVMPDTAWLDLLRQRRADLNPLGACG